MSGDLWSEFAAIGLYFSFPCPVLFGCRVGRSHRLVPCTRPRAPTVRPIIAKAEGLVLRVRQTHSPVRTVDFVSGHRPLTSSDVKSPFYGTLELALNVRRSAQVSN